MEPLVSCVLLTTHPKRSRFLPDALCAYRCQTYANRELVVINDGEPLEARAPDVRVVNLPPIGRKWTIGEKRNAGVRMARGEFIAVWDDDDISLPHRLSEQVAFALERELDCALADKMHIADTDMNVLGNCYLGDVRVVLGSALLRRDAAVRVGGYSASDYREDAEMVEWIRYFCGGRVGRMTGCDWYVCRRHDANVTNLHGGQGVEYIACGLRGPQEQEAARAVASVRSRACGRPRAGSMW